MLGQPGGSWASQLESQVPEFRAVGAGGGPGGRGPLPSQPRKQAPASGGWSSVHGTHLLAGHLPLGGPRRPCSERRPSTRGGLPPAGLPGPPLSAAPRRKHTQALQFRLQ